MATLALPCRPGSPALIAVRRRCSATMIGAILSARVCQVILLVRMPTKTGATTFTTTVWLLSASPHAIRFSRNAPRERRVIAGRRFSDACPTWATIRSLNLVHLIWTVHQDWHVPIHHQPPSARTDSIAAMRFATRRPQRVAQALVKSVNRSSRPPRSPSWQTLASARYRDCSAQVGDDRAAGAEARETEAAVSYRRRRLPRVVLRPHRASGRSLLRRWAGLVLLGQGCLIPRAP